MKTIREILESALYSGFFISEILPQLRKLLEEGLPKKATKADFSILNMKDYEAFNQAVYEMQKFIEEVCK